MMQRLSNTNRFLSNRSGAIGILLVSLLWSTAAVATELGDFKSQGLVGERADGYVGLVESAVSAEAQALVAEVNAKRKANYERIAKQHGIALSEVEALAGKKTLAKTASGQWIYIESWRRK